MNEPNKPDAQLPPWTTEVAWRILDALGYPYNRDDRPEVADWHRSDMARLLARMINEAAARHSGEGEAQCKWEPRPSRYNQNRFEWFTTCGVSTEVFNSCAKYCCFCGGALAAPSALKDADCSVCGDERTHTMPVAHVHNKILADAAPPVAGEDAPQ